MKKFLRPFSSLLLILLLAFTFSACGKKDTVSSDIWANALYTADTELGEGEKNISLEVKVGDKSVKFTVHTDLETVGSALLDQKLISGEDGQFGLYIKEVNGITADYDIDQSYWAFYIDGEYAVSGVDSTEITEGAEYQLVYTK